jgi:hypothetical protein
LSSQRQAHEVGEHTRGWSVFSKILHSYRANFENPKINLGDIFKPFLLMGGVGVFLSGWERERERERYGSMHVLEEWVDLFL